MNITTQRHIGDSLAIATRQLIEKSNKVKILLTFSIINLSFLFSGCATFESIKNTGKLAEKLTDYKSVYSCSPCELEKILYTPENKFLLGLPIASKAKTGVDKAIKEFNDNTKLCDLEEKKDTVLLKSLSMLSDYGKALEKITEDNKFDGDDQIEMLAKTGKAAKWFDLKDEQVSGAQAIAKSVFNLLSNSFKRKALSKEVSRNKVNINSICNYIIGELHLRQERYFRIFEVEKVIFNENQALNIDKRIVLDKKDLLAGYAQENRTDKISLYLINRQLATDTVNVAALVKATAAFQKAHNVLADNMSKVGTRKDSEVAKEVFNAAKEIYTGLKKL